MDFYVLTLFPEMIKNVAYTSVLGKAIDKGAIKLHTVDIRDYSCNKHMRVDDYPYGGGAGMVIEAEPVFRAVNDTKEKAGKTTRVVYLTPQAEVLGQAKVEELANEERLILLCGHYEGVDERVLEEVVTDYISIGDYVLTGGELPALVLMDAVSRFVPGVLGNEESSRFESHQDGLLEYPHYTRPEVWRGKSVPPVLLSGDHKKIEAWRYERSLERTSSRRPDLMEKRLEYIVVYSGDEKIKESAEAICSSVSIYGVVLDFGRAKLRKEKRVFKKNEVVIFVCAGNEERNFKEKISEIFKNIAAQESKLFFVFSKEYLDNGWLKDGTETCAALYNKGFTCLKAFALTYDMTALARMAKEIKTEAELRVAKEGANERLE